MGRKALVLVGLLILAGCASQAAERPDRGDLPEGCRAPQVKTLFSGFLGAINRGDRAVALRYVAPNPELVGFFFGIGRGAHAKRIDARTPDAVYRAFTTIGRGERFRLLRGAVGAVGPFAHDTRYPELHSLSTAGIDFVLGVGSRSASGKAGIDCGSGRMYLMPLSVGPGLVPPKQRVCGGLVRLDATRPVVCTYPSG